MGVACTWMNSNQCWIHHPLTGALPRCPATTLPPASLVQRSAVKQLQTMLFLAPPPAPQLVGPPHAGGSSFLPYVLQLLGRGGPDEPWAGSRDPALWPAEGGGAEQRVVVIDWDLGAEEEPGAPAGMGEAAAAGDEAAGDQLHAPACAPADAAACAAACAAECEMEDGEAATGLALDCAEWCFAGMGIDALRLLCE
jgi:hypothetical protein